MFESCFPLILDEQIAALSSNHTTAEITKNNQYTQIIQNIKFSNINILEILKIGYNCCTNVRELRLYYCNNLKHIEVDSYCFVAKDGICSILHCRSLETFTIKGICSFTDYKVFELDGRIRY
jgi:hypothetical protein